MVIFLSFNSIKVDIMSPNYSPIFKDSNLIVRRRLAYGAIRVFGARIDRRLWAVQLGKGVGLEERWHHGSAGGDPVARMVMNLTNNWEEPVVCRGK